MAGAYLARAGLDTVMLEARDAVGGASSTETPFGPDFKITTLSYVMSLMPPQVLEDLQLAKHGYEVHPMGPGYIPFPDGRSLTHYDDVARSQKEYAKFSKADAEALPRWEAWMEGVAAVLGPLLMTTPPKLGSRRPKDLLEQLRLAWGMRGLDVRGVGDVTRLFTMSITDLLDRWFESDQVKTDLAINGIIGTWAGPKEPGTAYVMLHHSIGEVGDGHLGSWGYPTRRHGRGRRRDRQLGEVVRRLRAHELAGRAHPREEGPGRRRRARSTATSSWPTPSSRRRTRRSRSCARSTTASCPTTSSRTSRTGRAAAAR